MVISWSQRVLFTLRIALPRTELRSLVFREELKKKKNQTGTLQKFPLKNKFLRRKAKRFANLQLSLSLRMVLSI